MELAFWILLLITFYTLFIYPVILVVLKMFLRRDKSSFSACAPDTNQPLVSFIIAAHNEEKVIYNKLLNTLDLEYPGDKMEIIVASDNSTDATNQIVRDFPHRKVILLALGEHKGKTNAQNKAANVAAGKVLVFSDANSIWEKNSLRNLLKPFACQRVGYVCGQLRYINTAAGSGYSEGLYWKYEMLLRICESDLLSVTAGNGAIYAVRATDYIKINPLYCHDLELPHLLVAKGKRALYEPTATAAEKAGDSAGEEYGRKVRMLTRTWHRIITGSCLYNPIKYGIAYSWMMVSHRLFRYLMPFLQIAVFVFSCFLWRCNLFYQVILAVQVIFYFLALAALLFKLQNKFFYLPYYFCIFNYASLVGFYNALTGKISPTWEKADSTR